MAITVSIDVSGAQDKIRKIKEGLADLTDPFEQSGEEIIELYGEKNFKEQGGALGMRWKSLSARTLLARQNRTGHYANPPIETDKILIWTGALKSGFKKIVEKTTLIVENTVVYFKFNQGSRTMIKATRDVIDIVSKYVIDHLRSITK